MNSLLAGYLQSKGLQITAEYSGHTRGGRRQPDFFLRNSGSIFGEGEWESSFIKGLKQAYEFGDLPGATGSFVISYPEYLRDLVQRRLKDTANPETLLAGVKFRGFLMMKGARAELVHGPLEEVLEWLRDGLHRRPRKEDPGAFISLMRDIVEGLSDYLPTSGEYPTFFEHIIATMPKDLGELDTAKRAAAYLLLNQVVFYRILSQRKYPPLEAEMLEKPSDLHRLFFEKVLQDDYAAIFSSNIASLFPDRALQFIRDMVTYVNAVQPESFTRDLLGSIFHELIPKNVRKAVAAYYTNPEAARLLAKLSIEDPSAGVADFACGSGTLLMAAYDRKAELLENSLTQNDHRRFLAHDITGCDIMPFAAHLAVVQLSLRQPDFLTDRVRIAVQDSTSLRPGATISTLQTALPQGQAKLHVFADGNLEKHKVRRGAVSSQGEGQSFKLEKVDVTVMNPPFTRKQLIGKEYRQLLTSRFPEYVKYASKEQSLFGYFVFLADRFLREGGRMGFVLPASSIRQASSEGMRDLIRDRYDLEFLILSGHRMAFSEDAAFSEVLLIARKREAGKRPRAKSILATLRTTPSLENVTAVAAQLRDAAALADSSHPGENVISTPYLDYRIGSSEELAEPDWLALLPGEEKIGVRLAGRFVSLSDVIGSDGIIQGIRFEGSSQTVNVRNTILSRSRDVVSRPHWEVENESELSMQARNHTTGALVNVPRAVLWPAVRSASGLSRINITRPSDFVVCDRFKDDAHFWDDTDPAGIVARRKTHLESRKARLLIAGRNHVDLVSDSTHFISFCSPEPVVPTWNFWSVRVLTWEASKMLCIWLNSIFALTHLYDKRITGTGTYVGWLKSDLLSMPVPNIPRLDQKSRAALLALFDRVADRDFPSLFQQLAGKDPLRIELDLEVARVLGIEGVQDREKLTALYDLFVAKLKNMREVQTGGRLAKKDEDLRADSPKFAATIRTAD